MNTLNIYLGTLRSENTKKSYGKDLRYMLSYIGKDESEITLVDLLGWVNHMKENNNSTATIARRVGSAKRYFEFLSDMDLMKRTQPRNSKHQGLLIK